MIAKEIWEGIKANDMDALKQLYQMYHQDLFHYGKRMAKDEQLIEDAIQETFISIWKYRHSSAVPAAVKQYIFKAFRNHIFNIFRQRSAMVYTEESIEFSFEISFEQKIIEGEDAGKLSAEINKAIQQLTNRQREIIYYRFYENLSFDQIAELMDMQTRATYKLAARALSALRQAMSPAGFKFLFFFWG